MQAGVREALAAGAIGVSTGTYYGPANAATADEIRRVCAAARRNRPRSSRRTSATRPTASSTRCTRRSRIARALGVRQVISHHKVIGIANFGRSRETLAVFDEARRHGDVCLDCYPYAASSTILRRDAVRQAKRVLVAWSKAQPEAAGRWLDELAAEAGRSRPMR